MGLTGPNLRSQLADRNRVNATNVAAAPASTAGLVVHLDLIYAGKQFVPEDLFDALETKFGSGKVVSDLDNVGRTGPFQFRILP